MEKVQQTCCFQVDANYLEYFRENGINDNKVLDDIKDCCVKTLISAEPHIASLVHQVLLVNILFPAPSNSHGP